MEKVSVTVRLPAEAVTFLDSLAESLDRDRSYLIKEAVENYVAMQRWRAEDIRQAIKEADAGEFLSDEETEAFMRWLDQ